MGRQGPQKVFVVRAEGSDDLVEDLQGADDLVAAVTHRNAQDRPGLIPGPLVQVGLEARIEIRIQNVYGLPGERDRAGDAPTNGNANFLETDALRDLGPQLLSFLIYEEQRAAVGVHEVRGLLHNELEKLVELELLGEGLQDLQEASDLLG